ncbi:MAG TPA: hypothetical protein PLO56_02635 [Rhodothermales bacterium]|nr:hypothetical protein [Rhodothermales bacterium]
MPKFLRSVFFAFFFKLGICYVHAQNVPIQVNDDPILQTLIQSQHLLRKASQTRNVTQKARYLNRAIGLLLAYDFVPPRMNGWSEAGRNRWHNTFNPRNVQEKALRLNPKSVLRDSLLQWKDQLKNRDELIEKALTNSMGSSPVHPIGVLDMNVCGNHPNQTEDILFDSKPSKAMAVLETGIAKFSFEIDKKFSFRTSALQEEHDRNPRNRATLRWEDRSSPTPHTFHITRHDARSSRDCKTFLLKFE